MASYFIPIEVQPGVGLVVGKAYAYAARGRDGRGGFADVFRVQDSELAAALPGTDLCLKCLTENFDVASPAALLDQPVPDTRRARLLSTVRTEYEEYVHMGGAHGHAPRAHALGIVVHAQTPESSTDAQYAFLLDWVAGMDLSDALPILRGDAREKGLPATRVARMGAMICDALADVHRRNVTHRDLSPKNMRVRLSEDDTAVEEVVLIDFGQSTTPADDETPARERRLANKPFGAPEMFAVDENSHLYQRRNDWTVDMWSLGALLYYLRTGEYPSYGEWREGDGYDRLAEAKRAGVTLPASCSTAEDAALQEIISTCCAFDPDDRDHPAKVAKRLRELCKAAPEPSGADVETPDLETPDAETPDVVTADVPAPVFPTPGAPRGEWLDFFVRWDAYWNPRGRHSDESWDADGFATAFAAENELVEGLKFLYGYKAEDEASATADAAIWHLSAAIGSGSEYAVNCLVAFYDALDVARDWLPTPPNRYEDASEGAVGGDVKPPRVVVKRIWDAYIRCLERRTAQAGTPSREASELFVSGIRLLLRDHRDAAGVSDEELAHEYSAARVCVKAAQLLGDDEAAAWIYADNSYGVFAATTDGRVNRAIELFGPGYVDPDDASALISEFDSWYKDGKAQQAFANSASSASGRARWARQVLLDYATGHPATQGDALDEYRRLTSSDLFALEQNDPKRLVHMCRVAAQRGDLDAMDRLAMLYLRGIGVERDLKTCANYLRAASMAGSAYARFHLIDLGLEKVSPEELARLESRSVSHTAEEEYQLGVQYELFGGGDPFYPYCRAAYKGSEKAIGALKARGEELPDRDAVYKRAYAGYGDAIREYELLGGKLTDTMRSILWSSQFRSTSAPKARPSVRSSSPSVHSVEEQIRGMRAELAGERRDASASAARPARQAAKGKVDAPSGPSSYLEAIEGLERGSKEYQQALEKWAEDFLNSPEPTTRTLPGGSPLSYLEATEGLERGSKEYQQALEKWAEDFLNS